MRVVADLRYIFFGQIFFAHSSWHYLPIIGGWLELLCKYAHYYWNSRYAMGKIVISRFRFPHMPPSLRHGTLHIPCGVGYVQVLAPHPESRINDLRERAVKLLHDWANSAERSDFVWFNCYLWHVCYAFYCLWIRNTKISEKSNMTNSWSTFCCPGTYKK